VYKDMLPRGGGSVCGFDKLTTLSLSKGRDGGVFAVISVKLAKICLGSAENPSVSLREPPPLSQSSFLAQNTHRRSFVELRGQRNASNRRIAG